LNSGFICESNADKKEDAKIRQMNIPIKSLLNPIR